MARSVGRQLIKEYLESSTTLKSTELEKGTSRIIVYLRLGMLKKDDIIFDNNKIKAIHKVSVMNGTIAITNKEGTTSSPKKQNGIVKIESPKEKLKRMME
jgi:hypothetical protein